MLEIWINLVNVNVRENSQNSSGSGLSVQVADAWYILKVEIFNYNLFLLTTLFVFEGDICLTVTV